ncbi:MAG: hypothetical protein DMD84_00100 [Candidatus Rokuibacteriota bacterium]|nr:MAG: hypothetical protein DMD84_00100 [Candidatus Rokubacteria bacterium]
MRRFRVSLAQINPTVGDIEGNTRRIVDGLAQARALGADLVAFPELAITGYPPEDLLFKSAFIEANLAAMAGYRVDTAKDGHEAILKARALRPDLVVMDLQMPKLDGWAAIRELRSRAETAAIPVIVLTGHDFKAYLKPAALAAGVVSYLMKPCFPEQLAREVGACLTVRGNRATSAL